MPNSKRIIISLGGSLLVPDAIDTAFVQQFKDFIVSYIEKGYTFILVTGGGRTARRYIDATAEVTEITDDD